MNTNSLSEARVKEQITRSSCSEMLLALNDPKTVEIMVNPDGSLWVEKLGQPCELVGTVNRQQTIALMKLVASYHDKELTSDNPILECEFPLDGSRFAGQIPPTVAGPTFTIRKKAISVFKLNQYVEAGTMTTTQAEYIHKAVANHRNILVIGGTGSGKTTLVNAIIQDMVETNPAERLVIIEDTGEIQCTAKNYVQFHTTINVSMTALLKTTLRMRPDRILIGEVRGPEALDLLMAWNTGHSGGTATLHANDAYAGLDRLATLISMSQSAPDCIEKLIAEAVNVVVCIERTDHGRHIREIIEVNGFDAINHEYKVTRIEN